MATSAVLGVAVPLSTAAHLRGSLSSDKRSCRRSIARFPLLEIAGSLLINGPFNQKWKAKPREHRFQRCFIVAERGAANDTAEVVIPEKSVSVILLAGGKGKRMGATMPKQYLPLIGQPIALYRCTSQHSLKFALPGKERQDSVRSGLQEISKSSKLACIHDSARPLVLPKDIRKVLKDAWTTGAAVLGVPVKATIKEAGEGQLVAKTLDRSTLWEMQTPQVIEPQLLHRGFELVEREGYEVTDDVSIVEYLKHPVLITEGSYTNLKVTTPDDLLVAERILNQSTPVAA